MQIIDNSNWMKYTLFGEETITVDLQVKLTPKEAKALQNLLSGKPSEEAFLIEPTPTSRRDR